MTDIKEATTLLKDGGYTCVLKKGNDVITTKLRGVKPLVMWINEGRCFDGYSAADKVVGRAAAFLYLLLGVNTLHATVISEAAFDLLSSHGIDVTYENKVSYIINRLAKARCPMESAVENIPSNRPDEALIAIRLKLSELANK